MVKFDISNTEVARNDMSKSEKYRYHVLLHIVKQGRPIAVYETAYLGLNMKQPTVRNIFQKLEKEKAITKYGNGSRRKLLYGLTFEGLVSLCNINPKMQKELDVILDAWFEEPKFIELLNADYGDVIIKNPDYGKDLIKKMIRYFLRVEEMVGKITDEEMYTAERILAEQKLLRLNPAEIKNVLEFYTHVKFYKDNVDLQLAQNQDSIRSFQEIGKFGKFKNP